VLNLINQKKNEATTYLKKRPKQQHQIWKNKRTLQDCCSLVGPQILRKALMRV